MKQGKALAQRIGRRGTVLLFFGWLDVIYAHGLWFPSETARRAEFYQFLAKIMPLWGWSALWAAVGVACLVHAFKIRDRLGFAAAMFLKVLWGAVAVLSWAIGDVERGYISAAIWLAAAGMLGVISSWPEQPRLDLRQVLR